MQLVHHFPKTRHQFLECKDTQPPFLVYSSQFQKCSLATVVSQNTELYLSFYSYVSRYVIIEICYFNIPIFELTTYSFILSLTKEVVTGPPQVKLQFKGPAIQKSDQGIYTSIGVNTVGLRGLTANCFLFLDKLSVALMSSTTGDLTALLTAHL